jgi:GNAT superfamily N-acetyltransferase
MGACGYVAEDDGLVVGYVCGVWEPSLVRSVLLKRHWPEVVFWGTAQLVVHPAFITSFVARIRELLDRPGVAETGYELRPIVVAPSVRGTGIAYELVATLLADAGRRGFKHMYLFTELDNLAGNAFYRKVGFSPSGIVYRSGVSYVRYKRPVLEAV